jgi:hypothetical protein
MALAVARDLKFINTLQPVIQTTDNQHGVIGYGKT